MSNIKVTKGHVWKHKSEFESFAMVTKVEFSFINLRTSITFDRFINSKIYKNQEMDKEQFLDLYFLLK